MIDLEKAKELIRRADSIDYPDQERAEIDTAAVREAGWEPLGEDYFFNESTTEIVGPSGGNAVRTVTRLAVSGPGEKNETERVQEFSMEWDRQVDTDPEAHRAIGPEGEGSAYGQERDKQPITRKCACDG